MAEGRRTIIINTSMTEAVETLEEMSSELYSVAVNTAMNGPWREWNESVPLGAEASIDNIMLRESGDAKISAILGLLEQAERLADLLR